MRRANIFATEADDVLDLYGFRHVRMGLTDRLGAQRIGASVYSADAERSTGPYHYHHGVEEWVYVITGTPTVRTPGGEQTLAPGDLVCFPAGRRGAHSVRGPGRVMMVSGNRVPSISVYPDSDKLGTRPADEHDRCRPGVWKRASG